MKTTDFQWAWNNYAPQPDKFMTRQRAARLLRAWRRVVRQPSNNRTIESLDRIGRGAYRVRHVNGETGTLIVGV